MEPTDKSVVLTFVAAGSLGPPVSPPSLAIAHLARQAANVTCLPNNHKLHTHHSSTNVCQQIMRVAILGCCVCVCVCVGVFYMGRRLSSLSSSSSSVSAPKLGSFCRQVITQQTQFKLTIIFARKEWEENTRAFPMQYKRRTHVFWDWFSSASANKVATILQVKSKQYEQYYESCDTSSVLT